LLGQLRAKVVQGLDEDTLAAAEAERLAGAERKESQALAAAERAQKKAAAELAEEEAAQREIERAHAAMHLRASLTSGQECPVCEQPVVRVPKAVRVNALEAGQARLQAARRQDEAARSRAAAAPRRAVAGERSQPTGEAARRAGRERAGDARKRPAPSTRRRSPSASARTSIAKHKGAVEERLRAALERLAAARSAHDAASTEHERASREREKGEQALAAALDAGAAARARARRPRAGRWRRPTVKRASSRRASTRSHGAPTRSSKRVRIERDKSALAEALQQAQRRERDTAGALQQAGFQREQAQRAMSEAQRALGEAGTALEHALAESSFKNAEAALAAALDAAARQKLQDTLDAFRAESHALKARVAELRRETGGERVASEALQSAETALADERRLLEDGAAAAVRLAERIADLERRARKAREKSEAMQRERRRLGVYQQLTTDLRSENFRAFVLEEAHQQLVAGASERLFALSSGRYTFEFQDDAFHVLDHDNARERRSAETLSGGETFLASLALALELSQQIQRDAGAVHLDSLFIDEGFGTLDPETLDTIAGTLEELPVGGRMVGIITHLPELTERIPNRVRVERRPEGSRFTVETA
jgi:exonuclease SbcC